MDGDRAGDEEPLLHLSIEGPRVGVNRLGIDICPDCLLLLREWLGPCGRDRSAIFTARVALKADKPAPTPGMGWL